LLLATLVAVAAAAGCGSTKTVTRTVTVTTGVKASVGEPRVRSEFGYVKSLVRRGGSYRLRFDPALMLSGETANVAAAEDGAVSPGEPVPNDNYVINDSKRLLTYLVAPDARVTVLKSSPTGARITLSQLAQLVSGGKPFKLFEPLSTGFWIVVDIDTVHALDQQYHP